MTYGDLESPMSLTPKRILLRQEYILAQEYISTQAASFSHKGVVITGNPGIGSSLYVKFSNALKCFAGKTYFQRFLLRDRLSHGRPTLFTSGSLGPIFFCEDGAITGMEPIREGMDKCSEPIMSLLELGPSGENQMT